MNSKYWSYSGCCKYFSGFVFLSRFPKGPSQLSTYSPFQTYFPLLPLCGPFPATVSTGGISRRLAGPSVTSFLPFLLMQARRRSLRNCVNRLCDVRHAPTNSMLQMTQGSTRHRAPLLGEARALASISFCHTSQDHWKKSGDGGWRGGAGSCPQFSVLAAEHTYCAESLVSSQTSSHYAVVRWVPKG